MSRRGGLCTLYGDRKAHRLPRGGVAELEGLGPCKPPWQHRSALLMGKGLHEWVVNDPW